MSYDEQDDEDERLARWYDELERQKHSKPGYSPPQEPQEYSNHPRGPLPRAVTDAVADAIREATKSEKVW